MNAAQRSASTSEKSLSTPLSNRASSQKGYERSTQRSAEPIDRLRSAYQPKRVPFAGARRAIALESSVKLTVNLLLAVVATTTIAKLVPYQRSQQDRLASLEESVTVAERKNAKLRKEFERNFDPTQSSRIMQEQSGLGYPNQKKIIWKEPPAGVQPESESPRN